MTKKKRDYRAEYRRRIKRGQEKGYSRSVAAGHARKGKKGRTEIGIKEARALSEKYDVEVSASATVKDLVLEDNKYTFGRYIRRRRKGRGDASATEYELRLTELQRRQGTFDWTHEKNFIRQMTALGKSIRDAYSLWFSPGGANG